MDIKVRRTAPLMGASLISDSKVEWLGEFRGTVENLSALATQHCQFRQFLEFARAPFYLKAVGDSKTDFLIGGDLRYDREPELGFAEMVFLPQQTCLPHDPNWESPSGLLPSDLR